MNRSEKFKDAAKRLGRGLAEFFNPRDWVPEIPIPRKPPPDARGVQSLGDALRGFPEKKK